ncbi:beta-propeller fold lactonase family protein [Achromobacter xylosoxidans]
MLAVGTYTEILPHVQGRGRGIHLLAFDGATASFHERQVLTGPVNPSYLCAAAGRLYGVSERERDAALEVYAIEAGGAALRPSAASRCPAPPPAMSASTCRRGSCTCRTTARASCCALRWMLAACRKGRHR